MSVMKVRASKRFDGLRRNQHQPTSIGKTAWEAVVLPLNYARKT